MLRRDLLSILDVAEFSKDGIFTDPSESFKLSQVVCSHCGSARDLDFCKDADLLPDEDVDHAVAWRCIQCHHEYSQLALAGTNGRANASTYYDVSITGSQVFAM